MTPQKFIPIPFLMLSVILCSSGSWANPNSSSRAAKKAVSSTPTYASTESTTVETQESGFEQVGLGLRTASALTFTSTALSGYAELDSRMSLEVLAGIQSTDPFTFGLGGLFKYTLAGDQNTGIHAGGGLGIGKAPSPKVLSTQAFAFSFGGLTGVHAPFPGSNRILLSLEGGAFLRVIDGEADLSLGGLSPALGAGILYRF